jgi:hypothetical protein
MTADLDHLRELTKPALIAAQHQLKTTGQVVPTFVLQYPNGELRELALTGDDGIVLNSGAMKDMLFALVRAAVKKDRCTAVLFVADTWTGVSNLDGLSHEEFEAECRKHGNSVPALAKAGLVKMSEAITITAQTPNWFYTTEQIYERDPPESPHVKLGEIREWPAPASNYTGRLRMYGVDPR